MSGKARRIARSYVMFEYVPQSERVRIEVVLNWFDELARLVED